jgi:hypothetical protein
VTTPPGVGLALTRRSLPAATDGLGEDDRPTHALYGRLGFVPTGQREVLLGLWITRYRHDPGIS